ncbi:MAG: hypothetical protein A2Y17_05915 [Clostridiales bacterium GWF2_38_85]|nr:MAG: hypothetical protein A2Y17_05915 [Clostridiales bacterium GWF2_38_85]HBL84568.1 cation-efflux pump [Clostridiales bacterium]
MTGLLLKKFIKSKNYNDSTTREKVGILAGSVGIIINILLFAAKFTVGSIFGFVSVTADAINNLSDSGSSVISLISSKLSNKSPDKEHPFGHQRIEYIASMCITFIIILLGGSLFYSSVQKIFSPDESDFSVITIVVLAISAVVKLWLYFFNMKLSKTISSIVFEATAIDSISDTGATLAVILSLVLSPIIGIKLDGFAGAFVAVLIFKEAINIIKDTSNHIIGTPPDKNLCDNFIEYILSFEGIIGVHDLMIHNYGPNRMYASVHAEISGSMSILKAHDVVDGIERAVQQKFGIQVVIHMDPVSEFDDEIEKIHNVCVEAVKAVDYRLTIHDFRVIKSSVQYKVLFDIARPYEVTITMKEIIENTINLILQKISTLQVIIEVDDIYTR